MILTILLKKLLLALLAKIKKVVLTYVNSDNVVDKVTNNVLNFV